MKTHVLAILAESLSGLGFEKRAPHLYTRNVNEEILGWLGLNFATQQGPLRVNPVVGVRHQTLEALVAELRGKAPHPYIPPTLSTPIGYLMPDNSYVTWSLGLLESTAELRTQIADIEQAVGTYAPPFMARYDTLVAIVEAMAQGKFGIAYERAYRVPVANYLIGDLDVAQASLTAGMNRWGAGNHEAAASFGRFRQRLETLIEAGPPSQLTL